MEECPLYFAGSKSNTRLLLVAATFEGILGLSIHLAPALFHASYYAPLRPFFPYLSATMLAGAVVLLMLGRHPVRPAVQRAAVLLPAAPLIMLGIVLAKTGLAMAPFIYTSLGLGVLIMPWQRSHHQGRDLFDLVSGLIQVCISVRMLADPEAFSQPSYVTIAPVLPLLGMVGLVGAGALFIPASPGRPWWNISRRVAGAIQPAIIVYNSYLAGLAFGVISCALLALTSLFGRSDYHGSRETPEPQPGSLQHLDRRLEPWAWLLALSVLLTTVVAPSAAGRLGGISVSLFILAITVYTTLAHWVLPGVGTPEQRVASHLTVGTVLLGLLVGETAPGGHSFLVLVPVPAVMASRMLGPDAGQRMLALAVACAFFGDIRDQAFGLTPLQGIPFWGHVAGQSLLLLVSGGLGVRRAQEKWDLLRDLSASERRFRSAFGEAPIGMALAVPGGAWLQVNRSFASMLGYTEAELVKLGVDDLSHPDDVERTRHHARALQTRAASTCTFEKRYLHRDGHVVWALISGSAISDENGDLAYTILHIQDITERKQTELQMVQLANFDTLTGLYNRHRFHEELEKELDLARSSGVAGALLFLDIDQFKYVNDTLGHQAGDDLLKSVAGLLQRHLPPPATVARLGGDEFAVLMPRTDGGQAQTVAAGLLDELRRHIAVVGGQPVTVTASAGIALYPDHGDQFEEILSRADLAMYQVKESGRNGSALYQPDRSDRALMEAKLTWERRIREALESDQFVPYLQPIMDLSTGQIVHYEMLLRLVDPQGQVVAPGAFLNVAERFGMIHAVDRWVVRRAIRLVAQREQAGLPICLEVNLSGKAFSDPELLPLIRREIAEQRINPASLILEITETAAIADTNLARLFIEDLEGLGCRFAIDDFGAGFSSFSYLKHLPVDYLKIDGSFIQNLTRDPVDQHLVKTMVDLARGLGKRTIAEFVGDEPTLRLLREYGVDYAQGFYVGEPEPLEAQQGNRETVSP